MLTIKSMLDVIGHEKPYGGTRQHFFAGGPYVPFPADSNKGASMRTSRSPSRDRGPRTPPSAYVSQGGGLALRRTNVEFDEEGRIRAFSLTENRPVWVRLIPLLRT